MKTRASGWLHLIPLYNSIDEIDKNQLRRLMCAVSIYASEMKANYSEIGIAKKTLPTNQQKHMHLFHGNAMIFN